MSTGKTVLIVVAVLVLLSIFWFIGSYNGLIRADETVNEKWANVQSAYQRRADLIPNLVSTVQGAVEFEKETQTEIAALRSGAIAAKRALENAQTPQEQMAAAREIDSIVNRFSGLNINVENYPQLKATENFLSLQDELAGTENRVKVDRDIFNKAVRDLNIKVRRFPTNIIAGMFGFEKRELFEAEAGSDQAPDVEF
ncbi:LemA family protein [Candidatus Woesearchaeota archaeon]|nr:LemA family protein [Candidatus Woesearchaeota archaeon]